MSRPSAESRGGAQQVSRPSAEPRGAPLLLFPGAPGLRSALSRRAEATRQMCCARGRLAVLERGGAGVQVHQLPVGSDGTQKPKFIKLEKKMKIHSVDQGAEHMLILSSDGKPFTYNYSTEHERPQCILQEKCIIQITCGDYHSLALSKGGELFAWGQNSHGQLGIGRIFDSTSTPQIVKHLSGVPLAQISAGKAHSMALSISGNMYSWGRNDFGQLGLGHTDNEDFPSLIEALDSQKVEFLACGGSHTALLTKDGLLFTFGAGKHGQLGHNSTQNELKPCLVTKLVGNRVTQVACGRRHTLAYVSNLGKVFSFGSGKEGQLGNGGTHNQLIPLPIKLSSSEELKFESHTSKKELIIIAGGNQSILLWMNKENPYVNLRRKIPTLNEGTIKRWMRTKQLQNTKREIKDIFSSPACLTGSFVRERITAEMKSVHLDLNKARNTFKELIQKEWITNMITTCLKDNLLKDLPFPSPHQEALEVFFLLPECPMMHDIGNWKDLVVPFAEAICKMSDKSSEALEEYWASLQESAFTELVQMFKRAISAQLCNWNKSAEDNCHLKALLETLKRLHRVNNANCQLSENTFHINELSNSLDFFEERAIILLRDNNLILEGNCRPIIFSEYPFIFNMVSKIKLWQADSMFKIEIDSIWQMTVSRNNEFSSSPVFLLQVRRSHLVEDALCQLSQAEVTDLRKALVIEFTEEIRSAGTGVKSEFFHCMFEEMTKAEYGMFVYPEEGSCMWFPVSPKFAKKSYFLFGILCGLSLYHFNVANIPFPLALFKKLLDQKPSLEDLKELSPGLGKSLQEVLNYEAEDTGEALHIYFSLCWDQNDVDLIPNGIDILVDQTNKKDYVSKCVDYIFNTSVKTVYEEFQRGFYQVCDKEILRLFHPKELMTAIVGNTDYDWKQFEKNSVYGQGYYKSHPTILMFWEAFHKFTLDEKRKFLFFLTGNDRQTARGLQEMGITFCCPETFSERDLPRSRVCHSILDLPKYSTMERLEEALQVAINNNRGFVSPAYLQ
uniref:HECT and RLD domain containing E3 ubiquitin protein ligase 5 n=2 Tax=Molossus molossus TaxID=27622 RepID=A0A7J8JTW5_MOLMO|nr:HECT and RLD domain containing E3 ubiquitin protein ligase 5 [Molossus molossus]